MPIISNIRRGSRQLKAQVFFVYLVLILGSATMIYPFLMMVSGSFKSSVDSSTWEVLPRYFYDDAMLFRKYEEARFNEDLLLYNSVTGEGVASFEEIAPPQKIDRLLLREWNAFTAENELSPCFYQLGQSGSASGFMPLIKRKYTEYLYKRFKGDIEAYNAAASSTITAWFYAGIPYDNYTMKSYAGEDSRAYRMYYDFKRDTDPVNRVYLSVENTYRYAFLALKYGSSVEDYNKVHMTTYKSYSQVPLATSVPGQGLERDDWVEFVRENLNRVFIEADTDYLSDYRSLLKNKYGDIARLNHAYGSDYDGFEEVSFPDDRGTAGAPLVDYDGFIMSAAAEAFRLTGPDILFKEYLKEKYGRIERLNDAAGTSYISFENVSM
ncbi:MAG: beta-galactosidase, partial [bacterium]|nr:beta-galactosidase [bacterium]